MRSNDVRQPSGKPYLFFGWYVLSDCFIIFFFQSGARYAFSVMFKPMLVDLGWNRTSLSGAYFLNMTFFALTMSISHRLYDRYGLSHVVLLSGFVTTVHHLAGGFWAYMGGMVFDRTGSYRLIFVISAAMSLIAVICALLIKEKRHGVSGRIGIEN